MDAEIIVVGAGAAGLAAAHALAKRNVRVTLIEARDRVGGRVWSCATTEDGPRVELGAEFIHGRATETMAVLREARVKAVPTDGDAWMCSADANLRREDDDFFTAASLFERAQSLESDETVDRFLQRFTHDPHSSAKIDAARAFVEGFDAADPSIASAQAIADEWCSGVDFTNRRPVGGYHKMFETLRKACVDAGVRIFDSTAVKQITWQRGGVRIATQTRKRTERVFQAQAAIITLPVGVLKSQDGDGAVAFQPPLPQSHERALHHIEMGHVRKVTLWFDAPIWEDIDDGRYRNAGFFRCAQDAFAVYWTQLPLRTNLITAWAGGPKATALHDACDREVVERAAQGFGTLFTDPQRTSRHFKCGFTHNWAQDDYSLGAYSYIRVGGRDARAALSAPIDDTLFFAGEATALDGQGGTVSGALNTGERAARQATELLRSNSR
ncbi:MAG: FAD-dependent oxidoreductase [Candidatus Eremiobacteraeota bacterium]|nr:FAD-dependent oxidoreductase [Candidatus Eremiobacteraeota bacterium]